jgi:hypothetical protein
MLLLLVRVLGRDFVNDHNIGKKMQKNLNILCHAYCKMKKDVV